MADAKDTRSRKWQLTLNNPLEKGYTHEKIKQELQNMKSLLYFCMADEIGENKTPHTHLYAVFSNAVRFSTMKNAFPEAHFEMARGTSQQNRDYIAKEGKWQNDEKHGTSIPGTFEEYGEMPVEKQGRKVDYSELKTLILDGATNTEIVDANPAYMAHLTTIDRVRQEYKAEKYRREFRKLQVVYIYGKTGTGKTRSVMEKYGYENVYRVCEYEHPFDGYQNEDVIVFDEFQSQLRVSEMLNYLDGYPLSLPCRYANRQACFTKVYIISNWKIDDQYHNVKLEKPDVWEAFTRRIHKIVKISDYGRFEYNADEYFNGFIDITDEGGELPFDSDKDESPEQLTIVTLAGKR